MVSLQPCDCVMSHYPSALANCIAWDESEDPTSDPEYTHSFIITKADGTIIDTLLRVRFGNLYEDYKGVQLLIGRYIGPVVVPPEQVIEAISKDVGDIYPMWRLSADVLNAGREIHTDSKVCSERSAEMLGMLTGYPELKNPYGWTPGQLATMMRRWAKFEVVFEGILA